MSEPINIAGLDKAEVLAALYNSSRQLGMGFMHIRGAEGMTVEEAAMSSSFLDAASSAISRLYPSPERIKALSGVMAVVLMLLFGEWVGV
jgi:hypothetical protein